MTSMQPQTGQSLTGDGGPAPTWSLDGVRAGAAVMVPALPGVVLFGAAFGALAAQKGLTLFETMLMSGIVFAGVSQIVSMEIWSPAMTPVLIATLAFTTLVINLRMLLMGASMRPWLASGAAGAGLSEPLHPDRQQLGCGLALSARGRLPMSAICSAAD